MNKGGSKFPSRGGRKKQSGRDFDSRKKYEKGDRKEARKEDRRSDKPSGPRKSFTKKPNSPDDFVRRRKRTKIQENVEKDTIRLNKFIAHAGICSRREADQLISQGLVTVNGKVVTEMGYQVKPTDNIVFDGQGLTAEKKVYVLLNKPKGYISTTKDEKARKTVLDLVANASPYRLYPVGRLDRSTTGVLLLTNDGHLTEKLTHPAFNIRKIYHVVLNKKLSVDDMQKIADGIHLEEGMAQVDEISFIPGSPHNEVGIQLHIGWNRVVRRLFQRLGYEVERLDRVSFAGLTKKNLKRGHWRILSDLEVNNLKKL